MAKTRTAKQEIRHCLAVMSLEGWGSAEDVEAVTQSLIRLDRAITAHSAEDEKYVKIYKWLREHSYVNGEDSIHFGPGFTQTIPERLDEVLGQALTFPKATIVPEDATPETSPDGNVEAVRAMLLQRSRVGLEKYGVTTERADLTLVQWLIHLQEELLDAAVYIEPLKQSRPSVLYRPSLLRDGANWCALYGENIQDGVCGFGDTPEEAMADFDRSWTILFAKEQP